MSEKVLAVIPARWQSTRLPGKPLVKLAGREMISRVWDKVKEAKTIDRAIVATDDDRILNFCEKNKIDSIMTSDQHFTGSDRVAEVAQSIDSEIYVNVQGDEPIIDPGSIDEVVNCLKRAIKQGIMVSTGYIPEATIDQLEDPSVGHLLPSLVETVITISRYPLPYPMAEEMHRTVHVGLYAFTRAALLNYSSWKRGPIERAESIEIMRFLEHGESIACVPVASGSIGVDTPEDVRQVEKILVDIKETKL